MIHLDLDEDAQQLEAHRLADNDDAIVCVRSARPF
jgi:hypothetical protein